MIGPHERLNYELTFLRLVAYILGREACCGMVFPVSMVSQPKKECPQTGDTAHDYATDGASGESM